MEKRKKVEIHKIIYCMRNPFCAQKIYFITRLKFYQIHRLIERFGSEGTLRCSSSNRPAMDRDTFHQTRLLKAPSNLVLNISRQGAATASLGNLGQGLNTLRVKKFFRISNLNLPYFSLKLLLFVLSLHALVKCPFPAFL